MQTCRTGKWHLENHLTVINHIQPLISSDASTPSQTTWNVRPSPFPPIASFPSGSAPQFVPGAGPSPELLYSTATSSRTGAILPRGKPRPSTLRFGSTQIIPSLYELESPTSRPSLTDSQTPPAPGLVNATRPLPRGPGNSATWRRTLWTVAEDPEGEADTRHLSKWNFVLSDGEDEHPLPTGTSSVTIGEPIATEEAGEFPKGAETSRFERTTFQPPSFSMPHVEFPSPPQIYGPLLFPPVSPSYFRTYPFPPACEIGAGFGDSGGLTRWRRNWDGTWEEMFGRVALAVDKAGEIESRTEDTHFYVNLARSAGMAGWHLDLTSPEWT